MLHAPAATAPRNRPKPNSPTPSRVAKIGMRIVAPPSRTAQRSRFIVAQSIWLRRTNRKPASTVDHDAASSSFGEPGFGNPSVSSRQMPMLAADSPSAAAGL
ncbi:MAG: hypothetical protein QM770_00285 [Tepidisphaeraceae bacterium]